MSRPIIDFETVTADNLAELELPEPVRLVLPSPRRGGPKLGDVRAALAPKGCVRFSASGVRLFADVDPGEPEAPLIALDTIARSDADGLERMLFSVLPHVDEIVLGIDGRSDDETLAVARAYADTAFVFEAADIGMPLEDWNPTEANPRGKIDFAAARNLGRVRVKAPWALVIDSDEYLGEADDMRKHVRGAGDDVGGFGVPVRLGTFEHPDGQRLARTRYRWTEASHNQLLYSERRLPIGGRIVCDTSLRTLAEQAKRNAQRQVGIEEMVADAAKGNLTALFHVAKHSAGVDDDINEAVRLVESYRLKIEPHSPLADERAWLALTMAFRYFNEDNLGEADRWAVRALLDGPRMTAFCLLGDIAECDGDLVRARGWYECACALTEGQQIEWPGVTELRYGRLSGIRKALAVPERAREVGQLEIIDDDAHPDKPSPLP
ncbi:MAG: hypothetical protein JO277_08925 [Candidatus Eremiobacteraeota bacterium]|nr:hypothetical protein [Candidatus Eremiobacteraeota bacterium]